VFSSIRPATTYDSEIYIAVRSDPQTEFSSADKKHLGNLNSSVQNLVDPFFAADGRKLYLAYNPVVGSGLLRIGLATRVDTSSDFGPPIAVPVISDLDAMNRAPAVSTDERIIVFSSDRAGGSGGTDLWYATRPDAAHDFGAPAVIPGVNSPTSDDDPMLSADGCELYFSSSRTGDDSDLYVAQIAP
jgi:Tol biopolymer transport system component